MASTIKYGSDLEITVSARDDASDTIKRVESGVIRMVGAIASATAILAGLAFPARGAANFEAALLDVKKTTGFTTEQIKSLGDEMLLMSQKVDISAIELTRIAAIAGQLGLGAQGGAAAIAAFTETAARFASVLDVSVETAATNIAKITNVFDIAITEAESVSAAINEISNTSTAAGSDILDIVNRVGDIGNITLSDAIGIAAFSKDVGLANEVASTSFSKMIANLTVRAEQFADLMGVTTDQWVSTVNNDALGALFAVAEQLNNMGTAASNAFIKTNLGGGRIFTAFTKLKNEIEGTTNSMEEYRLAAQQAQIAGTSSIEEQENVLSGLNAQAKIMVQNFENLAEVVGAEALPWLKEFVKEWSAFLKDPNTIAGAKEFAREIGAIAGVLLDVTSAILQNTDTWNRLLTILKLIVGVKIVAFLGGIGKRYVDIASNVGKIAAAYKLASVNQKAFLAGTAEALAVNNATSVKQTKNDIKNTVNPDAMAKYAISVKSAVQANKQLTASMKLVEEADSSRRLAEANKLAALEKIKTEKNYLSFLMRQESIKRKTMKKSERLASYEYEQELRNRKAAAIANGKAITAAHDLEIAKRVAATKAASAALAAQARNIYTGSNTAAAAAYGNIAKQASAATVSVSGLRRAVDAATTGAVGFRVAMTGVFSAVKAAGRGLLALVPVIGEIVTIGWLAWEAWDFFSKNSKDNNKDMIRKQAIIAQLEKDIKQQTEAQKNLNEELEKEAKLGNLKTKGLIAVYSRTGDQEIFERRTALMKTLAAATVNAINAEEKYKIVQQSREEAVQRLIKAQEELARQEKIASGELPSSASLNPLVFAADIAKANSTLESYRERVAEATKQVQFYAKTVSTASDAVDQSNGYLNNTLSILDGMYSADLYERMAGWFAAMASQGAVVKALKSELEALNNKKAELVKDKNATPYQADELAANISEVSARLTEAEAIMKRTLIATKDEIQEFSEKTGESVEGTLEVLESMSQAANRASNTGKAISIMTEGLAGLSKSATFTSASISNMDFSMPKAETLAKTAKGLSDVLVFQLRPALEIASSQQGQLNDRLEDFASKAKESASDVIQSYNDIRTARDNLNAANNADDSAVTAGEKAVKRYEDELALIKERLQAGELSEIQARAYTKVAEYNKKKAEESLATEKGKLEAEKNKLALAKTQETIQQKLYALIIAQSNKDVEGVLRLSTELDALGEKYSELAQEAAGLTYENTKGKEINFYSDEDVNKFEAENLRIKGEIDDTVKKASLAVSEVAATAVELNTSAVRAFEGQLQTIEGTLGAMYRANANIKKGIEDLKITSSQGAATIANTIYGSYAQIASDINARSSESVENFRKATKDFNDTATLYTSGLDTALAKNNGAMETFIGELKSFVTSAENLKLPPSERLTVIDVADATNKILAAFRAAEKDGIDLVANPTALRDSIGSALENTTFNTKVNLIYSNDQIGNVADRIANLVLQRVGGRADGGYISGKGTGRSDSILSWLSNGEYVMPAHIVRMFGSGFFDLLRKGVLPLPKFANGGMAGVASNVINNNGLQLSGLYRMDINQGDSEYTLFAEKRSIDALAGMLNRRR